MAESELTAEVDEASPALQSARQDGAQRERDDVRKWVKRNSHLDDWGVPCIYIDRLEKYLDGRAKRYNKRPGGLGARKAKG